MKVTAQLFEAHIKCSTKCWLLSQGEAYADWFCVQNDSYRSEGVRRLLEEFHQNECVIAPPEPVNLKAAKWRMAVDMFAQAYSLESRIHAAESVSSKRVRLSVM